MKTFKRLSLRLSSSHWEVAEKNIEPKFSTTKNTNQELGKKVVKYMFKIISWKEYEILSGSLFPITSLNGFVSVYVSIFP